MPALDDLLDAQDRATSAMEDMQKAQHDMQVAQQLLDTESRAVANARPSTAKEIDYWSRCLLNEIPEQQLDAEADDPEEARWLRIALYADAIRGNHSARTALSVSGRHPGGRPTPTVPELFDRETLKEILEYLQGSLAQGGAVGGLSHSDFRALLPLLRAVLQDGKAET